MDACIFQDSGTSRLHPAIRITALWTSSYYQKGTHSQSWATPALILRSFLVRGRFPESSLCLSLRLSAGIPWPARSCVAGARRPHGAPAHLRQLFPVGGFGARSHSEVRLCSCMACSPYFVHNVIFRVTVTRWPSGKFPLFFSEAST